MCIRYSIKTVCNSNSGLPSCHSPWGTDWRSTLMLWHWSATQCLTLGFLAVSTTDHESGVLHFYDERKWNERHRHCDVVLINFWLCTGKRFTGPQLCSWSQVTGTVESRTGKERTVVLLITLQWGHKACPMPRVIPVSKCVTVGSLITPIQALVGPADNKEALTATGQGLYGKYLNFPLGCSVNLKPFLKWHLCEEGFEYKYVNRDLKELKVALD